MEYKNININSLNFNDLKKLQEFLIQQGYLDATYKNKAGITRNSNDGILGSRTRTAYEKYNSQPEIATSNQDTSIDYSNLLKNMGLV